MTNAEIAVELHVSLSTVKTHLADDQAKLDARNRVEIAARAWGSGPAAFRPSPARCRPRRRVRRGVRGGAPGSRGAAAPPQAGRARTGPRTPATVTVTVTVTALRVTLRTVPAGSMSASPTTEAGRARGLRKGPRRLRPPRHGRTRRSPRRTPHRGPQPRRGLGRHRRPTPVTDAVSQADMPRDLPARATYSRQP
ncbi:helix-turn-helix transcriptional regulator [Streptomyces virginiae]|uniref:helix-turn-helix transcriptional regulator n=1 Tax=Streptomyces virginiae TaxID=1961 RepID=UPI0037B920BB